MTVKFAPTRPPPEHPSGLLRDLLAHHGVTVYRLCHDAGLCRVSVNRLMAEEGRITPRLAFILERYFGTRASLWLSMQSAWDAHNHLAKHPKLATRIKKITPLPYKPDYKP